MAKKDTTKKEVSNVKAPKIKKEVKVDTKAHNEKVTKELGEIVDNARKELLDLDEKILITAKFSLSEITMKADGRWKIKMLVHKQLPKGDHDYSVKLEFDDEPFLKTIKQLEKDIAEVEANPTLLQSIDNDKINRLNRRIDETQREMLKNKKECPDIEFVAQTEQIKWTADTSLVFKVLDTVIEPLNKQRFRLSEYRVVLETI